MLAYILDKFRDLEVEEFIFVVGHLGDQIETYVSREYQSFKASYVVQDEMLGQAHAIWLCRDHVDGPVFMVFGDTFFETDLDEIKQGPHDSLAYVHEVHDPRRFGVAIVGPGGYVRRFVEKPMSMDNRLAVIGMYYFHDGPALMQACGELMEKNIQTRGEYFLTDALNLMIPQSHRFVTRSVDVWHDSGKPETVLETNRYLLDHGRDNSAEVNYVDSVIIPPVNIHPSASIEYSVIGPHATIGQDCRIVRSIIRDSIIEAEAQIEDSAMDQSLIGKEAVVKGRYQQFNVGDSAVVGYLNGNDDE
jgi:glucose-1-phosphate thymidylyltransferase